MVLDELDKKIINELIDNPRITYRKLARSLGVSVGTVYNRIRKLIGQGIIRDFTVQVDFSKVGYDVTALILVKVDGKHIIDVEREVARYPNVCAVYDVTGEFDVIVVAKFRNIGELNKFIKNLLSKPYVLSTNTSIALNVVKENFKLKVP
ncbi:MAG: AsnC family transcriptional regulator [Desulfurococcales archaeon ex4484_217_1]|nr:MAG: AsnC family transcriptional regulator [Desulfurococcales archaeon ex4484_217_1]